MKKALKIIGGIFLALIVVGNIAKTITKQSYENSIEAQIKRANRDCPIPVANGVGQISSIILEDKLLTYNIDYKSGFVDIDAFKANPDATRDMFYLSFVALQAQGNYVKEMINELLKRDIGLRIIISDGTGSKFCSILSPDYISDISNRIALNPSEALHEALKLKILLENNGFPIEAEEGMILTGMTLEGNNIIVFVELDENLYDMSLLKEMSTDFGYSLLEEANNGDPELGALFDLCKISHSGLVYRMRGKQSMQQCDMGISSDEIRRLRKIPTQVSIH
ncbi:MAG: hypothetical protein ACI3ZZ_01910 [Candidatus Aphodosoma sp.]